MAEVVKKRNLKMVFLLIGNGPLENELRAEIEQRKLGDYCIFAGVVHQPQDYLQMMDAFILPSLFEGLPMAGVEAQAAGLPTIVSSNVTDEVMLTEYIYKLPIDQPDAWVHKLETLPWDRMEGSEQIKKKGFDITEEADRLEAIYKELIREL
jgi:glycosyltransferase involved in cell wall biosynthesis